MIRGKRRRRLGVGFRTVLGALLIGVLAAGCSDSGKSATIKQVLVPAAQRTLETSPGEDRTVEESDLAKLDGTWLYVQNPTRGLTVIDVSDPDAPSIATQTPSVKGKAGELYVTGTTALVVFEESDGIPGQSEVVAVTAATTTPVVEGSLNVPGTLVASRLIGNLLYLVTAGEENGAPRTWITSVDVSNPAQLTVADSRLLTDQGVEVHVTGSVIYIAQTLVNDPQGLGTQVRYIDISDPQGAIVERGSIKLSGTPQGRFQMDADGTTFRIVTYVSFSWGSDLYVIDATNPDSLTLMGALQGIAPTEALHATRFVGDKVYIVTFRYQDPLFVVSLADPANPVIEGHLDVPGWSDYLFVRPNNRLLAVGRGAGGGRVAVALFDVSNPNQPLTLRRLEFGIVEATSTANTDFRGVRIVEAGVLGQDALVSVPYTNTMHVAGDCKLEHHVQLVDLLPNDVVLRGDVAQVGLVRRTLPIGTKLYAVTDKTVAAIDVSNRDAPFNAVSLETGDLSVKEECPQVWGGGPVDLPSVGSCTLSTPAPGNPAPLGLLALAMLLLIRLRRRAGSR